MDDDSLFPLEEAAPLLAGVSGNGLPPKWETLARWTVRGKAGVRLECCRRRGVRLTSRGAVERFKERVAAARGRA